jgi:hypothetical protein
MTGSVVANVYFRLLYETWRKLYRDSLAGIVVVNDFLLHEDVHATNARYLASEPSCVTNEDIIGFATKCMKSALFVANAFGFKNFYHTTPGGYADLCEKGAVTKFAQKSTRLISENLHLNFNTNNYPDYIYDDEFLCHAKCPVIYGVDIGHELYPLRENSAFVPSGFCGKRYMSKIMKVRKTQMRLDDNTIAPNGKLYLC